MPVSEAKASPDAAAEIKRAVIWVHGLAADANTYFCDGVARVKDAGVESSTLSLAPWFGDEQLTAENWTSYVSSADSSSSFSSSSSPSSFTSATLPADAVSAYWTTTRWVSGGNSSPDPARFTTSFDALDAMVDLLLDLQASGVFPNLEQITLSGFSAGSQILLRWAFFSDKASSTAAMTVRTIISDPGTYLFFDATRPDSTCNALENTGTSHSCDTFAVPSADDLAACPEYDEYKYGTNFSELSSVYMYLDSFVANSTLVTEAIAAFAEKDVRFLLGDEDVCNCNTDGYTNPSGAVCYPSGTSCAPNDYGGQEDGIDCCDTYPDTTSHNALSTTCSALLQGSNRLQRGLNYVDYLNNIYNSTAGWEGAVVEIFEGGHSNAACYASSYFEEWALGIEKQQQQIFESS
eukprot:g3745.t1